MTTAPMKIGHLLSSVPCAEHREQGELSSQRNPTRTALIWTLVWGGVLPELRVAAVSLFAPTPVRDHESDPPTWLKLLISGPVRYAHTLTGPGPSAVHSACVSAQEPPAPPTHHRLQPPIQAAIQLFSPPSIPVRSTMTETDSTPINRTGHAQVALIRTGPELQHVWCVTIQSQTTLKPQSLLSPANLQPSSMSKTWLGGGAAAVEARDKEGPLQHPKEKIVSKWTSRG